MIKQRKVFEFAPPWVACAHSVITLTPAHLSLYCDANQAKLSLQGTPCFASGSLVHLSQWQVLEGDWKVGGGPSFLSFVSPVLVQLPSPSFFVPWALLIPVVVGFPAPRIRAVSSSPGLPFFSPRSHLPSKLRETDTSPTVALLRCLPSAPRPHILFLQAQQGSSSHPVASTTTFGLPLQDFNT